MTAIILKVQLKDEIRRVSLNLTETLTLSGLEAKIVGMFPQLQDFVMQVRNPSTEDAELIYTDDQFEEILWLVRSSRPPILRISIIEGQSRPLPSHAEIVISPQITLERAELRVHSIDDEELELENGDDEEEVEEEIVVEEEEEEEEEEIETVPEEIEMVEISDASKSLEYSSEVSQEPDSICSFCKSYIGEDSCFEKVRFKCVNCPDVLCDYCEEQGVHDPSHLLVKLRVPVSRLPLKQQIVFVSHIEDPSQRESAREKKSQLRQEIKSERRERRKLERLYKKKARKLARQLERKQRRKERKMREQEKTLNAAILEAQAQLEEFATAANVLAEAIQAPPEEALPQREIPEDLIAPPEEAEETATLETEILELENADECNSVNTSQELVVVGSDDEESVDEEEDAEEEWQVSYEGFQVVEPASEQVGTPDDDIPEEMTPVDLERHRIQGFAFREKLQAMEAMGFGDRNRNLYLLLKNFASLEGAVAELVSTSS